MADFDLTFHYPPGWTLLATGKPAPSPAIDSTSAILRRQAAGDEQAARWVSERPIPVAGFNLGKYVRGTAQAGNVTRGHLRDGRSGTRLSQASAAGSSIRCAIAAAWGIAPAPRRSTRDYRSTRAFSCARSATAVAEVTARAIRYYADRFGPFPYSQLALTQLPGRESQGWPGLIFLSSLRFPDAGRARRISRHSGGNTTGTTSPRARSRPPVVGRPDHMGDVP